MRYATFGSVGFCATQFLRSYVFIGNGFYNIRSRNEHIATVLHHYSEISHRRGIHRSAGTGPHNGRNLRNNTRSLYVSIKDICIAAQRPNAFLNACATRIVQPNHRCANTNSVIHYFTDFLCVGFRKCPSKNRKILCKNIYQTTVDCSVTRNNAITVIQFLLHIKISGSVGYEYAHFFKGAFVEKIFHAFAGGKFFLFVLFCNSFFAAAFFGFGNYFLQFFIVIAHFF